MRVLVACESSGTVGAAFQARGHDVLTCDLLPTDRPDVPHYQGDVFDVLDSESFDLMVAHPPCTHLAVSGARHFAGKVADGRQAAGLEFVRRLLLSGVPRIAVENPVSIISTRLRPSDQMIHPWQYGHGEMKQTCLWLDNLPRLRPTNVVAGRVQRVHNLSPSPDRWRLRSVTFPGIAAAMADQWGSLGTVQGSLFDAAPYGLVSAG